MTNLEQIHKSLPVADEINISVDDDRGTATSLTELEARLHVRRNHPFLPTWRYHAAGRALARLREHGFDLDTVFDVEDLCQAHYHIVSKLSPTPSDECSSLETLLEFPALPHDLAVRIRSGVATLSDALLAMKSRPDFKDPSRIAGAVTAFAEKVEKRDGTPLEQIPARLKQVAKRFVGMTHADFGVGKGTFTSMKSRIRKAVMLVDMSASRRLPNTQLLPAWQVVTAKIEAEAKKRGQNGRGGIRGDRAKIGRLIAFCHERRIDPAQMTDATVDAMHDALVADGQDGVFELAQDIVYAWQRLQRDVPGFPEQKLSLRYRARDNRAGRRALESLPLAFQAAWLDFENRFGAPDDAPARSLATLVQKPSRDDASEADDLDEDPFALDEDDDDSWADDAALPDLVDEAEFVAGLSPGYVRNIKSAVIHAGRLLQDVGRPPSTLHDVVRFKVVERLLLDKQRTQLQADHSMPEKNSTLRNVATCMIAVARLLEVAPKHIEALMDLRDRFDPFFLGKQKKDGVLKRKYSDHRMGPRHKERIAAMADDNALLNWFEIMATLHGRLKGIIDDGKTPTGPTPGTVIIPCHRPGSPWSGGAAAEVVAQPGRSTIRQHAALPGRHGSLRRCAPPEPQAQGPWSRRPADAGKVRSPLLQGPEERFPRCGGDRRGSPTADDEVRGHQDRRAA